MPGRMRPTVPSLAPSALIGLLARIPRCSPQECADRVSCHSCLNLLSLKFFRTGHHIAGDKNHTDWQSAHSCRGRLTCQTARYSYGHRRIPAQCDSAADLDKETLHAPVNNGAGPPSNRTSEERQRRRKTVIGGEIIIVFICSTFARMLYGCAPALSGALPSRR